MGWILPVLWLNKGKPREAGITPYKYAASNDMLLTDRQITLDMTVALSFIDANRVWLQVWKNKFFGKKQNNFVNEYNSNLEL